MRKCELTRLQAGHASQLGTWVKKTRRAEADRGFDVPAEINTIFRRDLEAAAIPYRDKVSGDYLDSHSLRHCTASYLNAAGIPPSVVLQFLRHKTIKLSMVT